MVALLLAPAMGPAVEVGQAAPELTLASIRPHTDPIELSSFRGKVVYLDFWSSWCAPCRRAIPDLSALRNDLFTVGFEVVAVNVDTYTEDARRFLAQTPVSYPIAVDATAHSAATFGVSTLPAAYLIDREGMVRRVYRGAANVQALCDDVKRLINGPSPSQLITIEVRHGRCAATRAAPTKPSSSKGS
jgi:thiol-disulfide isomerase/thioredoxin